MSLPIFRRLHIALGLVLALLVLLQAGTGLLLSFRSLSVLPYELRVIHHGGGGLGTVYRVALGAGLIFMSLSGAVIFFKTRKLLKKT